VAGSSTEQAYKGVVHAFTGLLTKHRPFKLGRIIYLLLSRMMNTRTQKLIMKLILYTVGSLFQDTSCIYGIHFP